MNPLDSARLSGWLRRLGAFAASRQVLDALIPQVVAIAAMFLLAWGIRAATRAWTDRLVARATTLFRVPRIAGELQRLLTLCYAWPLLVIVENVGDRLGSDVRLVGIAASLTALWIVLRASARLMRDAFLARVVATFAWVVAALDILGLLGPTAAALDSLAVTVGTLRLSILLVIKAGLMIAILLWAALALARLISVRLQRVTAFSPSIQVLTGNLIKIALVCVALLIGLNTVGIDLTAFTVFSGAVGVGLGFGLQKIVSNFVSGIILLLERSVKPGDVIEVGSTFGSIIFLGARYASVRGRDGKEYLIPNENLITNEVVNWSYSNSLVRLDAEFGVAYASDLHAVRDLSVEVARATARVLETPRPVCHVTGFGDSAVNLILRFWIADPANGVTNVKGDVLLGLWDAFLERGIELPFPQRDLHIRDLPSAAFPRRQRSRAQQGIEEERD
ncbi:MAG TPA: mechanosensitive ion channel domain-containing protein [Stellaceae bacterium]|nr:mechanosensitive ion channel domain-containing protein [Stellaceae bacterium]